MMVLFFMGVYKLLCYTLIIDMKLLRIIIQIIFMYQERPEQSLSGSARQNFVKKVYTILSAQLSLTVFMVYCNYASPAFAKFQAKNQWLFWVSFITTIATLISLYFAQISKSYPTNMIVLSIFTLAQSYMVSLICSMYTAQSVLLAAIATLSATLGLTYHAMTTAQDYTSFSSASKGFMSSLIWTVFSVSLINLLFLRSSIVVMGLAILMSIVYSIYIIIDTQRMLGGKHQSLSLDDYILGAVILYVDIISLFLKILQILGKKKDD